MENLENFLDEYLETAKEGAESTLQGAKRIGLLIGRSLLVVILVPFWLVGRHERRLTKRALDAAIVFPELKAALDKVASVLSSFGEPPRR